MEGSSVYRLSENGIPSALVFQIESQYTWQPWIPYIKFLFCLLDGTGCSAAVFYLSLRDGLIFVLRVKEINTLNCKGTGWKGNNLFLG